MIHSNLKHILKPHWKEGWAQELRIENGWCDLVLQLHDKILNINPDYKIIQIKEKFGALRFYYEPQSEEIQNTVDQFEQISKTVCEYCGGLGKPAMFGRWCKTCCEDCLVEFKADNPTKDCRFVISFDEQRNMPL